MIGFASAALGNYTPHVGRSQPLLDLVHGVKREVLQKCRLTYTPAARGTYPAVGERERQEQVQGEALHGCNAEHRIGQGEALQESRSLSFTAGPPTECCTTCPAHRREQAHHGSCYTQRGDNTVHSNIARPRTRASHKQGKLIHTPPSCCLYGEAYVAETTHVGRQEDRIE